MFLALLFIVDYLGCGESYTHISPVTSSDKEAVIKQLQESAKTDGWEIDMDEVDRILVVANSTSTSPLIVQHWTSFNDDFK